MGTVIRNFRLSVQDFELLEEGLHARRKNLIQMRAGLTQADPAEAALLAVIEQDIEAGDDMLGRLRELIRLFACAPSLSLRVDQAV